MINWGGGGKGISQKHVGQRVNGDGGAGEGIITKKLLGGIKHIGATI